MKKNLLKDMLYTKRLPTTGDIEVFAWYKCSLDCDFCKQPHSESIGLSKSSLAKKVKLIKRFIKGTPCDKYIITVLGGELFDNAVSAQALYSLLNSFSEINKYAKDLDKKVEIGLSSNLIFSDVERVKSFLYLMREGRKIHSQVCISYDIAGRNLTYEQLELFKKNEKVIEDYVDVWNFNLTRDTCLKFVNGFEDPYFDYLYNKYPVTPSIYYDYEETWKKPELTFRQRPDELDLLEAVKVIAEKYPRCLSKWIKQAHKIGMSSLTCPKEKMTILPDNTVRYCLENNSCCNGKLMLQLAEEKNCLACPYLNHCQQDCLHTALDKRIKQIDPCVQQQIYDHLAKIPLENIS